MIKVKTNKITREASRIGVDIRQLSLKSKSTDWFWLRFQLDWNMIEWCKCAWVRLDAFAHSSAHRCSNKPKSCSAPFHWGWTLNVWTWKLETKKRFLALRDPGTPRSHASILVMIPDRTFWTFLPSSPNCLNLSHSIFLAYIITINIPRCLLKPGSRKCSQLGTH